MNNGSHKIPISQRWDPEFQRLVKTTAGKYGMSMTQLTTEALQFFIDLMRYKEIVELGSEERRETLLRAVHNYLTATPDKIEGSMIISTSGIENIGLIRERVATLLKNNPNYQFSTNEIAEILNIPQSTARTYVRNLNEENPEVFILLRGRPNKIYYHVNSN